MTTQRVRVHQRSLGTVFMLAVRDLRWEALLTLCIVTSLAAAVAPLLVLYALKSGFVTSLRADLIEDPVFREIRPTDTRAYDEAFFHRLREHSDVVFVIPSITRGASTVIATIPGGETAVLDMVVTGPGDPLLENFGIEHPADDCVVVTMAAVEELGGQRQPARLTLSTSRTLDGRRQSVELDVCVAALLPVRADSLPRAYVPLQLAVDIEMYREGFAVPTREWDGEIPILPPAYDGAFVATEEQLSAVKRAELTGSTGFFLVEDVDVERVRERLGIDATDLGSWVELSVVDQAADSGALDRLENRLAGYQASIFGFAAPSSLRFGDDGSAAEVFVSETSVEVEPAAGFSSHLGVAVPERANLAVGDPIALSVVSGGRRIGLTGFVASVTDRDDYGLSLAALSVLRRAEDRAAFYDDQTDSFLTQRESFRGFRLYARSIEDVPGLVGELRADGVDTIAQVQAIERVRILDRGLDLLFWLIAVIVTFGSLIAILANLYSAVERKKAALAHLRLLGLRRTAVALLPIYQGAIVTFLSSGAAFVFAWISAGVINSQFSGDLGFEGSLAILPAWAAGAAAMLAVAIGFLASLAASLRAMSIDPAEAIRNE